jgi:putative aldouronate transport system permease protein
MEQVLQSNLPVYSGKLRSDNKGRAHVLRGILTFGFSLIALIFLLCAPIFSFGDESVSLKESVGLFGLLGTLGSGGSYSFTTTEFGRLTVQIPSVAVWLVLLTFVFNLANCVLGALGAFGILKKHDRAVLSVCGLVSVVYQCIVFCVLIGKNSLRAKDILGESQEFYRVFSVSASYLVSILCAVISFSTALGVNEKNTKAVRKNWLMYLFLVIPGVLVVVYNLYPMLLSFCLSMKNYVIADGVWGSTWVGLNNYIRIFSDSDMLRIVGNTILISVLRMLIAIIPPLILSIMLFDMGHLKLRKGIQTVLYIPHFFSWVVVYAIAYSIVNPDGLINNITGSEIRILANENTFIPLLLITDLWKECGWNTILYMAALSNVDPSLQEAASIDGAGPLRRLWSITLPSIKPTIVFITVMSVGNLLKGAGYEQIMLFGSDIMKSAQVIDTWVVWKGLQGLEYGLGAAVSFFQSLIGMVMVLLCNYLSKKWVGVGLY